MGAIDETRVMETDGTMATEDSPTRSIATSSSPPSVSANTLQRQIKLIEDAEIAQTMSRSQYSQEEVLENPQKQVSALVFKYILIGMGLFGVLIGIVLGAIIGKHLLNQNQNTQYMPPPPSFDVDMENNSSSTTEAPSLAPGIDWHYPPTPTPSHDIFNHHSPPRAPVRTAHPTVTLLPTKEPTSTSNNSTVTTSMPSLRPTAPTTETGAALGPAHMNDNQIIVP